MAVKKEKSFKIDFFVVTNKGNRKHSTIRDLLNGLSSDHTEALALDEGDDEKFQVRSIVKVPGGNCFKGVFGRCRFGEKPVQGKDDGTETDVDLKPGHGLVEKNYFLFFPARNLLVYQRNSTGSHYSRLQRYLNMAIAPPRAIVLEPILTTDSYKRLINGGSARTVDISFQQPKDATIYKDALVQDAIKLVGKAHGLNARIRIGVGRTKNTLLSNIKEAAIVLAQGGLARVARIQLEDESEPVDLIADRIVETIQVKLDANGRPNPDSLYGAMNKAVDKRQDDLKTFYGS